MTRSDTLWEVFRATGYIGAYILYRETQKPNDDEPEDLTRQIKEVAGI